MSKPLSPAAQAVLDSVVPYPIHEAAIAAELEGGTSTSSTHLEIGDE